MKRERLQEENSTFTKEFIKNLKVELNFYAKLFIFYPIMKKIIGGTTLLENNFDKFKYYGQAVQSPDADAEFLSKTYKEIKGKNPVTMREDFCAAFELCCEWVKLDPSYKAIGIDLDEECLDYGTKNYLSRLSADSQKRVSTIKDDVLRKDHPKADVICALNFSYFGFKTRPELKAYFESVYVNLEDDGIIVMDCFGGPDYHEPNENEIEFETDSEEFSYYWDQDSFDPITNEAQFYIHFKRKGEQKEKEYSHMTGECGL